MEHNICPDGKLLQKDSETDMDGSFETFFRESNTGQYVPRAVFVDLEPSVVRKQQIPDKICNELLIYMMHRQVVWFRSH